MKRLLLFSFVLIVLSSYAMAGSVGISPAYYVEHFEPNLEKTYSFRAFNPNLDAGISIFLEGSLAQYANLSSDYVDKTSPFTVHLKLPENLSKPGSHILYVAIREAKNDSSGGAIGGLASIRAPIKILVPYPGQYVESELKVGNINEGELAEYDLEIQNLGDEDTILDVFIEVFSVGKSGNRVLMDRVDDVIIKTKNSVTVSDTLATSNFEAGDYYVQATITYSNKTEVVSDNFRIGEFLVDIVDYDYMFDAGRINQFDITIENRWNTRIDSVYADVTITDEGKVVSTFRTVSVDTSPWEVKEMTGFFDATDMEVGRYLANMRVNYGDSSTRKLVAIYIEDPPKERNYLIYALIAVGVLSLVMFIGFAILISKLKRLKLEAKNGRKRK
jgi:hypothetical protein